MIHDASNESGQVPEELYNLTQLADVTLAAGKLSTTSVLKTKETIKLEEPSAVNDSGKHNGLLLMKCINSMESSKKMNISPKLSSDGGYISDLECNEKQKSPSHSMPPNGPQLFDSDILMEDKSTLAPKLHTLAEQRQSSFSSSEDDSTYNYSHKIFDKRKSRKQQAQLDDARNTSKTDNSSKLKAMSIETEDSMLSVSENECNEDDGHHKMDESQSHGVHGKVDGIDGIDSKSIDLDMALKANFDVHTCPECGKKYSTSSNLARHRQTHRSLHDKKARRCPHCDKVYVSSPAYSMHVRTHNQGCECPHCGKRFSRPWLLQGHIRTHTGEKPFQCSICTKSFADKSNLRAHIQTHSNTKPHTCGRCGKAFALKSYLYKHEESSCMRNHSKLDKDKTKYVKIDIIRAKSTRKVVTMHDTSTMPTRKPKEKHLNELTADNRATSISSECIYLDVGSKKSYIDLTEAKATNEQYPRISVIRTVSSTPSTPSTKSEEFEFCQEKPVDFSPKHKYKADFLNGANKNNPLNEIPLQYTTMVI